MTAGIFFKRLLWTAATNLFAAWIIIDANLWHEFDEKCQQNITNIKYDFIIGKFSQKFTILKHFPKKIGEKWQNPVTDQGLIYSIVYFINWQSSAFG